MAAAAIFVLMPALHSLMAGPSISLDARLVPQATLNHWPPSCDGLGRTSWGTDEIVGEAKADFPQAGKAMKVARWSGALRGTLWPNVPRRSRPRGAGFPH